MSKSSRANKKGLEFADFNNPFTNRVLLVVSKIPRGKVMTYGQVAALAGSPGAARAVGNIMKNNYNPKVPCHRVVAANGKIGGYNRGGSKEKRRLLIAEGALSKFGKLAK